MPSRYGMGLPGIRWLSLKVPPFHHMRNRGGERGFQCLWTWIQNWFQILLSYCFIVHDPKSYSSAGLWFPEDVIDSEATFSSQNLALNGTELSGDCVIENAKSCYWSCFCRTLWNLPCKIIWLHASQSEHQITQFHHKTGPWNCQHAPLPTSTSLNMILKS